VARLPQAGLLVIDVKSKMIIENLPKTQWTSVVVNLTDISHKWLWRPRWRGSLGGQRRWLIDQIGGKASLGLLSQPEPRSLSRVKPVRAA